MSDNEQEVKSHDSEDVIDGTSENNDGVDNDLGDGDDNMSVDDQDLEAIRARVKQMEEEAQKIREMQSEVEKQMNMSGSSGLGSPLNMSFEEKAETDARSVYVGNVDYGSTAEELEAHFHGCGAINRVTILCDKFSGNPKGFAYIEFSETDSVQTAAALDESLFRGRQIKVMPKRTNKPGISSTNRFPRRRRYTPRYIYSGYRRPRGFRRRAFYAPY